MFDYLLFSFVIFSLTFGFQIFQDIFLHFVSPKNQVYFVSICLKTSALFTHSVQNNLSILLSNISVALHPGINCLVFTVIRDDLFQYYFSEDYINKHRTTNAINLNLFLGSSIYVWNLNFMQNNFNFTKYK